MLFRSEVVYPSVFDANNYIPFEQITDENLLQWAKSFLGDEEVQKIESIVTARFNNINMTY